MQTWPNAYDFQTLLAHFFELRPLTGVHRVKLTELVETHARTILSHPDAKYIPAFKVLDLLAEMVNRAAAIDEERQLRAIEAIKLCEAEFAPTAPLLRNFMLEAALERARYEPIMMHGDFSDAASHRSSLLEKRWRAMREAHRGTHVMPDEWLQAVDAIVLRAIGSDTFREYRVGPLLQMFAEMLQSARQLHGANLPLHTLNAHIGEKSALWKRYQLKAKRFRESHESQQFDTIPTDFITFTHRPQ